MFSINNGKTVSDEGFEVEQRHCGNGEWCICYTEAAKTLVLDAYYSVESDDSTQKALVLEVPARLQWWKPAEVLHDDERVRILGNIGRALEFREARFKIIPTR